MPISVEQDEAERRAFAHAQQKGMLSANRFRVAVLPDGTMQLAFFDVQPTATGLRLSGRASFQLSADDVDALQALINDVRAQAKAKRDGLN